MGLKEQQIQRYEAENYVSASLRRLVEVSGALGLKVAGSIRLHGGSSQYPQPSGAAMVAKEGRGPKRR